MANPKHLPKWTIIMFMSAENNLFPEMIGVMEELYSVKLNQLSKGETRPDVNFVVLFDGLQIDRFSEFFAIPSIYDTRSGNSFMIDRPVWPKELKRGMEDLTKRKNLKKVFDFVKKKYKAANYGFIYKGHGGTFGTDVKDSKRLIEKLVSIDNKILESGDDEKIKEAILRKSGLKGWNFDAFYDIEGITKSEDKSDNFIMCLFSRKSEGKLLSYKTLSDILLEEFGKKGLGFVFLDCCWGQLIESAYTFSACTDYFIASADEMPAAGIGYNDFYLKLLHRPRISSSEIANLLVSIYYKNKYDDYDDGTETPEKNPFFVMGVSLTNVDTRHFEVFNKKFENLCVLLIDHFDDLYDSLSKARALCKDHTYVNNDANEYAMYNIDLLWFLDNLLFFLNQKDTSLPDELSEALDQSIKEVQTSLVRKLRKGFLSSNYADADPGKTPELGGQGITITFPENIEQLENSIMKTGRSNKPEFYSKTRWQEFIDKYTAKTSAEKLSSSREDDSTELRGPAAEPPGMETIIAKNRPVAKGITEDDNIRKRPENGRSIQDAKQCKWGKLTKFKELAK